MKHKNTLPLLACVYFFASTAGFGQTNQSGVCDSIRRATDSLEVSMLETTATYQQVERLIRRFPPESASLNLLPSVLPIDAPIEAFRITSPFGLRKHPISRQAKFHAGVDVRSALGNHVKVTAPGRVSVVGYDPALGAFVRVEHAFGFETTYGHLQGYCVKPGQTVSRNQEIGRVGQTGLATGPHLHYTIKKNGSNLEPFNFCFLLRRRLWLYQTKPDVVGISSDSTAALSNGK